MKINTSHNIFDKVYLILSETEMKYHSCCFRPTPLDEPVERTIHSIIIDSKGVKYQLKGCGLHISESDFGNTVFDAYEDAKSALNAKLEGI